MSQRSGRLWQDSSAHRKIFEGDEAICQAWYGFAMIKLGFLLQNQPGAITMKYFPAPEVVVEVSTRPNSITIKAPGSLYMESGFYTFTPIGIGTEVDANAKAYCHYNAAVSGLLSSDTPDQAKALILSGQGEAGLSGEVLESGFLSRAFNYQLYLKTQNSDPIGPFKRKYEAMMKVPSSVFAGKLQLLVQAKYGSKKFDLLYPQGLAFDLPYLLWERELLNPIAKGGINSGLFTTADYEYFLMQVGGGEARFVKLKFSGAAEALRQKIKNGDFDDGLSRSQSSKTRAEAYLLAQAEITEEEYQARWTQQDGFIPYYGFQWNWDGTEGQAVKMGIKPYSGGDYCIEYKQCKLTITHNIVSGAHVFAIEETALVTKQTGYVTQWFALCYPFPAFNNLVNGFYTDLWPSGSTPFYSITAFTDVPVYCYRDHADTVHVLTISQNLSVRTDTENNSYGLSCYPSPRIMVESINHNGLSGDVSATISTLGLSGEYIKSSSESRTKGTPNNTPNSYSPAAGLNLYTDRQLCDGSYAIDYMINSGYVSIYYHGMPTGAKKTIICSGFPTEKDIQYGARSMTDGIVTESEEFTSGREEKHYITAVIPYTDCHAVYVIDKHHALSRTAKRGYSAEGRQIVHTMIVKGYFDCYSNFIETEEVEELTFLWGVYNPPNTPTTNVEPAAYTENCYMHINGQYELLVSNSGGLVGGEYPGTIGNYDYFYFSLDDPYVNGPDYSISSLTGERYKCFYEGVEHSDTFPGITAVGWA